MNANQEKVQKLEQLLARVQRNSASRAPQGGDAFSPRAPQGGDGLAPNPLPLRDWAPVQTRRPVEPRGGSQPLESSSSVSVAASSSISTSAANRVGAIAAPSAVEAPSVRVTVETLGQPVSPKPVRNTSSVQTASTDPARGGVVAARDQSARPLRVLRFGEWISATLRLRPRG
jgi:hypothetical protein